MPLEVSENPCGLPADTNLSASVSMVPLPFLKDPTAVHVAADEHDTPRRLASVPTGFGVASNDQLVPSHCSPSVSCWPRMSWKKPTARQLLDEVHDTPFRTFCVAPGLVVFSRNHWLPFHRRPRVKTPVAPLGSTVSPTAMQALAAVHETPVSGLKCAPLKLPPRTGTQAVPFHSAASSPPAPATPTAMHDVADTHDTALNPPSSVTLGWICQLDPFQRSASGCSVCAASTENPTAVHALTDVHETPFRAVSVEPGGAGTDWEAMLAFPSLPFQSAASGSVPEFPVTPASSHSVVVGHDEEIAEFLSGRSRPRDPDRVLATILLAIPAGSPATGIEDRGPGRAGATDARHAAARHQVRHHRGRLIENTDESFLATFQAPGQAIRCATAVRDAAAALGTRLRFGIHTGEVDLVGDEIAGTSRHIAGRVAALAQPAEILVSRTVKDLVAGSGISFTDRGTHKLNELDDEWPLFAVSAL